MNINIILSLGIILLLGLVSSGMIRKIKLPSITAYLILGILIGPAFLNLVSAGIIESTSIISNVVLSFIAFSIGQNFSRDRFKDIGKSVISLSVAESLGAAVIVGSAMLLFTDKPVFVAISFAALAPATAPAAIVMIVREFRAKGRFTDTLLAVVALDDSWGLIIFALLVAVAKSMTGMHESVFSNILSGVSHGVVEIFGAILLGIILGWLFILFSKYLRSPKEILIYTLGFILLNAGVSTFLGTSVLLSNMVMATFIVNNNKTNFKFFNVLREIDSPFYLLFFVLAGTNLEIESLKIMGYVGVIYIAARMSGKILGIFFASHIIDSSKEIKKYLGIALAPQAGVALGMAMIIKNVFPEEGAFIMSTIIATTVFYEIFGPVLTKIALQAANEIG